VRSILIQKREKEHNSLPEEKNKLSYLKVLHKFAAHIRLNLSSKYLKWLGIGAGVIIILLSLWCIRIYHCANCFLTQGKRYIKENNLQKATESLHRAIKSNPRLLDAYLCLSKIYLQEEKSFLAVDELLKASKIFPNNPTIDTALKKAYQKELLSAPQVLRVGIRYRLNPLTTIKAIEPLLSYLSKNLKCRIRPVLFPNYGPINQYLKEKKIDIAILGPEDFMRTEYEGEVLPLVLVSPNKQNSQRGIIVTSRKNNIRSIKDLKGKSFAFADSSSLTGYILPRMILLEEGIDPEKDFSRVYFMNSQEEIFLSLVEEKVDAGVLAEHIFHYLTSIYSISGEMRILARSSEIPPDILVVRKNIPKELIAKIKNLLVNYPQSIPHNKGIFREYTELTIREENTKKGKVYTVIFGEF